MPESLTGTYEKVTYDKKDSPFACTLNQHRDAGDQLGLAWHEEMEIKYIISGSMHINFGTKSVQVQQGDIVVVNSCQYHTNQIKPGEEVTYHLLCVDISRLGISEQSLFDEGKRTARFRNVIRDDPEAVRYAQMMFASFEQEQDPLLSLGLFLAFFANLKRHRDEETYKVDKRQKGKEEIVQIACAYIHDRYAQVIRLGEIASRCYVSESHFCRVFREFTGETPISYINKLRVNKAMVLMNNSELTFDQIATQVGFADSAYFCRNFKKYTGVSPTAYCKARERAMPSGEWKCGKK